MKKTILLFITLFSLQAFAQESKQYDKIGRFSKGLAIVWRAGHCGIITQGGKELVKPEYDKIGTFGNDGLAYTTKEGKVGLMNMEGKVVVPNIYESISRFNGYYAITRKNGLAGMINKQGKILIANEYENIKVGRNGEVRGVKDGRETLMELKN